MKVATIVPSALLEVTRNDAYLMALAHLIKTPEYEGDERYTNFFAGLDKKRHFVIMDNGAAEAAQCPNEALVAKAMAIGASEMVLPDEIHNKDETLRRSSDALEYFQGLGLPVQYMAVPQGQNLQEWLECALEMSQWPISCLGVSKFITQKYDPIARFAAVALLNAMPLGAKQRKDIHLLGCWGDPRESAPIQRIFKIRGTDSAIAYVFTKAGLEMLPGVARPPVEIHFTAETEDVNMTLLLKNKSNWYKMANGLPVRAS